MSKKTNNLQEHKGLTTGNRLSLKTKKQPRKNWESAFKRMHANGEDKLLIPDVFSDEQL